MMRLLAGLSLLPLLASAASISGVVEDADTHLPLPQATLTAAGVVAHSGPDGRFRLESTATRLAARAPGYLRAEATIGSASATLRIALKPFRPKALYLSVYGIGSPALRTAALQLIDSTELNALVIDVKGDRGWIPYPSEIAFARQIGANHSITIKDMPALLGSLKARGLYLIARIVVFKDDLLANARPDWAVTTVNGQVWRDREKLAWADPFRAEVWRYNLDIAEEAARLGFDEIQFDYVRFPDSRGVHFSRANTRANRTAAIEGFLAEARRRLAPYNVFIAADVFGYVCWNLDDTAIGQQIEGLARQVDYLSPMLYPSGFQFGIPGVRQPVANPYSIVSHSLAQAQQRTRLPGVRFRPWLQAFRDYAFDRSAFGAAEIRAQISAAEAANSDGWMLWNPRNHYENAGLMR